MIKKPLLLLLLAMSTALFAQTPAVPQIVTDPTQLQSTPKNDLETFTLEKLYAARSIGAAAWSPDGKQVVFVASISGHDNLWLLPAEGGWPVQLTISDQHQDDPTWSPDRRWIAYTSGNNGHQLGDIYLVSPRNGEVVNLTSSAKSANAGPAWSPDGTQVAYMTRPVTSLSYEIEVIDVLTRKTIHVTRDTSREWSNVHPIWSRDGKWLAWTMRQANGQNSNVFVAELATGKAKTLTAHPVDITPGGTSYEAASWSADGRKLLITSNAANGYPNVALLDVASKQMEWLTREKYEVRAGNFSPDGSSVTWTTNRDGNSEVDVRELANGKTTALPLRAGENSLTGGASAFSPDGRHLLCHHAGPEAPGDLLNFDLTTGTWRQITNSLVGGLSGDDMVKPAVVHYPSHDGKWQISALAYIPHNIVRNAHYPAMVWIHDAPASQARNGFNRFIQYIVNQGYVVIAPNYRGSTGYGKQFQDANRMDAGGGDLQDVLDAAAFISKSGFVDPKKLIVMGAGYGGYLSLMAASKAPETWAAAVSITPFVNWFTRSPNSDSPNLEFAKKEAQPQASDRSFMGDPVQNKALWEERSPINFIERIQAPLLLLADENDPQFPPSEARQVADAIRKHGGTVQLKIYAHEGQDLSQPENQLDADKRVSDFIKSRVPSPGCGCSLLE